jgi:hypothetical protein
MDCEGIIWAGKRPGISLDIGFRIACISAAIPVGSKDVSGEVIRTVNSTTVFWASLMDAATEVPPPEMAPRKAGLAKTVGDEEKWQRKPARTLRRRVRL